MKCRETRAPNVTKPHSVVKKGHKSSGVGLVLLNLMLRKEMFTRDSGQKIPSGANKMANLCLQAQSK